MSSLCQCQICGVDYHHHAMVVGRWQCRMHPGEVINGRYSCCRMPMFQLPAGHPQLLSTMRVPPSSARGCVAIDHGPWTREDVLAAWRDPTRVADRYAIVQAYHWTATHVPGPARKATLRNLDDVRKFLRRDRRIADDEQLLAAAFELYRKLISLGLFEPLYYRDVIATVNPVVAVTISSALRPVLSAVVASKTVEHYADNGYHAQRLLDRLNRAIEALDGASDHQQRCNALLQAIDAYINLPLTGVVISLRDRLIEELTTEIAQMADVDAIDCIVVARGNWDQLEGDTVADAGVIERLYLSR